MDLRTIITLACGFGALLSLYWGLGFLVFFRERNTSSQLLGGLFLVVGIRMIKSSFFIFSGEVPLALINIGFAAHYFVGPMLFLYLLSLSPSFQWSPLQWIHFLPGLAILPLMTLLSLDGFWYQGGYGWLLLQSGVYLFLSAAMPLRLSKVVSEPMKKWTHVLVICMVLFVLTYFSNYQMRLNPSIYALVLYALVIYYLSFYLLQNRSKIVIPELRYKQADIKE